MRRLKRSSMELSAQLLLRLLQRLLVSNALEDIPTYVCSDEAFNNVVLQ
jgi:hypothetical protein